MPDLSSRTRYPGTKGSNLCPLQWKHGILTSGLPGNSLYSGSQLERKSPSHQGEFRNVWQCFFTVTVIRGFYFHWMVKRQKHITVKPKMTTVPLWRDTSKLLSHMSSGNLIVKFPAVSQGGSLVLFGSLFYHTLASYLNHCSPPWSSWT